MIFRWFFLGRLHRRRLVPTLIGYFLCFIASFILKSKTICLFSGLLLLPPSQAHGCQFETLILPIVMNCWIHQKYVIVDTIHGMVPTLNLVYFDSYFEVGLLQIKEVKFDFKPVQRCSQSNSQVNMVSCRHFILASAHAAKQAGFSH